MSPMGQYRLAGVVPIRSAWEAVRADILFASTAEITETVIFGQ